MAAFEFIIIPIFLMSNILVTFSFTINNTPLDGLLNFTGLAIKYGMICEEYDVNTSDGYILKLFHIPGDKSRPVLLMHGFLGSADDFLSRGHSSMISSLHKRNYDIWASNLRGNRYSRRHVALDPDRDSEFWDFGLHEHGIYDLSVSIDFVLNKTNGKRLSLIGFSAGNTIMYILGSMRPEYNDKTKIIIAWGPICYVHNVISTLPMTTELARTVLTVLRYFQVVEILGYNSTISDIARCFCTHSDTGIYICHRLISTASGFDPDGIEPEYISTIFGHFPAGTARKNFEHLFQILLSRRFAQYDYGSIENLARYQSIKPPVYDLKKVTAKVAMIASENDSFSTIKDVDILVKKLPNVVKYKKIEKLNHLDYIWGRNAYKNVYTETIEILDKYNHNITDEYIPYVT